MSCLKSIKQVIASVDAINKRLMVIEPRMINAFVDENALAALAELESNTVVAAKRNVRVEFIDVAPLTADTNGNDSVEKNPEKSYYWFVKCAEAGDDEAMFNVGLYLAKGFGTERDFAKAAEWMQKAADEGDEDAEKCVNEYRRLAEATTKANEGDAKAQAELAGGLLMLGGSLNQAGEGKDYEESLMWAKKAIAQGCPDGYWALALAYHQGVGVDDDMEKAIELYKKGAELGSASCQYSLGRIYMDDSDAYYDCHKGFELIKIAAEQGYGLAMLELGSCYQFADGTEGDMNAAIEWYEKALAVLDDPELEQKVMWLKMVGNIDEGSEGDYPEEEYPLSANLQSDVDGEELQDACENDEEDTINRKETEVSDEEVIASLQSGDGFIKQVATMADGSRKEIPIWGGYQLDGYDRTTNVFMNFEDIGTFVKIVTEDRIDLQTIKDPCEFETGIQVSIDFLDVPAMLLFRKGQGKLSTELYSRDEKRTFNKTLEAGTGELELDEEGAFSFDIDALDDNSFYIFVFAVLGVRRYLMKEGIAQKLYDMFDESAGVVLNVSKTGSISAKIVKGKERPDLPCDVFPFGEQICRPYIDEMLGLKSSAKRPHKTE